MLPQSDTPDVPRINCDQQSLAASNAVDYSSPSPSGCHSSTSQQASNGHIIHSGISLPQGEIDWDSLPYDETTKKILFFWAVYLYRYKLKSSSEGGDTRWLNFTLLEPGSVRKMKGFYHGTGVKSIILGQKYVPWLNMNTTLAVGALKNLIETCPNLVELRLYGFWTLKNSILGVIAECTPHLRRLAITGTRSHVYPDELRKFKQAINRTEPYNRWGSLTAGCITLLAEHSYLPNLEFLDLSYQKLDTEEAKRISLDRNLLIVREVEATIPKLARYLEYFDEGRHYHRMIYNDILDSEFQENSNDFYAMKDTDVPDFPK